MFRLLEWDTIRLGERYDLGLSNYRPEGVLSYIPEPGWTPLDDPEAEKPR